MSAEIKIRAGLVELTQERDAFKREAASLREGVMQAHRRVHDLEERLYGNTARQMASFYTAEWERRPDMYAYTISLRPKQMQYCLSDLHLIDSRHSMLVVNESIEKVTRAVAKDLADQLKAQAWEVAKASGRC